MNDRRSAFRKAAEAMVRFVLVAAKASGLSARGQRKALREAFKNLLQTNLVTIGRSPRSTWYAAVRDVTGSGVLELVDPSQQPLPIDAGPRRPRARRKESRRAH